MDEASNSRVRRLSELLVELLVEGLHGVEPLLVVELLQGVPAAPLAPPVVVVGAAVAAAEGAVAVRKLVDFDHVERLVAPRTHVRLPAKASTKVSAGGGGAWVRLLKNTNKIRCRRWKSCCGVCMSLSPFEL